MNQLIAQMIKASGRSWWQARYADGRVLSEWDTMTTRLLLPVLSSRTSRWEEIPKKGMVGLRLLCPNGMVGELEAPEGCKFFQLKVGRVGVKMGAGDGEDNRLVHEQDAHIIGVVKDDEGNCLCRAWETVVRVDEQGTSTETIPPGSRILIDSSKNWGHNVLLGKKIHVFGQTAVIWGCDGSRLSIMGKWRYGVPNNREYQITSMHKRLIEFEDNVQNMKYHNIGKLSLDVQGLKV